jgi:hypothetical protein
MANIAGRLGCVGKVGNGSNQGVHSDLLKQSGDPSLHLVFLPNPERGSAFLVTHAASLLQLGYSTLGELLLCTFAEFIPMCYRASVSCGGGSSDSTGGRRAPLRSQTLRTDQGPMKINPFVPPRVSSPCSKPTRISNRQLLAQLETHPNPHKTNARAHS